MKTTVRINKVFLLTDCEGVMITTRLLQTLAELLEEFQEGVLFLSSVGEHLQALLHEVVLDHASPPYRTGRFSQNGLSQNGYGWVRVCVCAGPTEGGIILHHVSFSPSIV